MLEKVKKYFIQIQKSDEKTRRHFIFVFSTISTLIVIIFWIMYLTTYTIAPVDNNNFSATSSLFKINASNTSTQNQTTSHFTFLKNFWETFKKGFYKISSDVKSGFLYLENKIKQGLEFFASIFTQKTNIQIKNEFPFQDYLKNYNKN